MVWFLGPNSILVLHYLDPLGATGATAFALSSCSRLYQLLGLESRAQRKSEGLLPDTVGDSKMLMLWSHIPNMYIHIRIRIHTHLHIHIGRGREREREGCALPVLQSLHG